MLTGIVPSTPWPLDQWHAQKHHVQRVHPGWFQWDFRSAVFFAQENAFLANCWIQLGVNDMENYLYITWS